MSWVVALRRLDQKNHAQGSGVSSDCVVITVKVMHARDAVSTHYDTASVAIMPQLKTGHAYHHNMFHGEWSNEWSSCAWALGRWSTERPWTWPHGWMDACVHVCVCPGLAVQKQWPVCANVHLCLCGHFSIHGERGKKPQWLNPKVGPNLKQEHASYTLSTHKLNFNANARRLSRVCAVLTYCILSYALSSRSHLKANVELLFCCIFMFFTLV